MKLTYQPKLIKEFIGDSTLIDNLPKEIINTSISQDLTPAISLRELFGKPFSINLDNIRGSDDVSFLKTKLPSWKGNDVYHNYTQEDLHKISTEVDNLFTFYCDLEVEPEVLLYSSDLHINLYTEDPEMFLMTYDGTSCSHVKSWDNLDLILFKYDS